MKKKTYEQFCELIQKNLTTVDQFNLACNIFTGENQNDFGFFDEKTNKIITLSDCKTNEQSREFYEKLDQFFMEKYPNSKAVFNYLISRLYLEYCDKNSWLENWTDDEYNYSHLDDLCCEIFEY